ncbi:hypothetical protein KSF_003910 [Reticulibacter mediterranei]|uniref:Uncharacterized protein n=1 Tax=Reticulibacter mediterranei TaxID=2778369 RepID=A0A8J3ID54_9CHLR|nr:hypothetical protein KSF_003910 [Reticulibacter mediterranei]
MNCSLAEVMGEEAIFPPASRFVPVLTVPEWKIRGEFASSFLRDERFVMNLPSTNWWLERSAAAGRIAGEAALQYAENVPARALAARPDAL